MREITMRYTAIITVLIFSILYRFLDANSNWEASENKAVELLERYNSTVEVCIDGNGITRPAYECSGILIRGVCEEQKLPHAWSMKPSNIEHESFSVSFLRKDQPFSKFPFEDQSGFIIYPHLMTPKRKHLFESLCAYPVDGFTDFRRDRGCGMHFRDTEGISRPCDEQGIDSLEKWMKVFNEMKPVNEYVLGRKQCAFNTTDASSAARNFNIFLAVGVYLHGLKHTRYAYEDNELKIRSWESEMVKNLPIEVFFYLMDSEHGLEYAKKYRGDYFDQSEGEMVPIVGIRLPSEEDGEFYVEPYDD